MIIAILFVSVKFSFFFQSVTHFLSQSYMFSDKWIRANTETVFTLIRWGVRWLSGRMSDSGARGRGFETYFRRECP